MKNGKVHYNYAQWYGYRKGEDGASQPIPHEAETVERIYRDFLSGDSIGTIKKALVDLVACGVANKTMPELGGQFRAMSDEIKALQTLLEDYKSQRQAVTFLDRQMGEICETLGKTTLAITEYDDKNVRQLIDTIKVVGDSQLLIIFKGGFALEQTM